MGEADVLPLNYIGLGADRDSNPENGRRQPVEVSQCPAGRRHGGERDGGGHACGDHDLPHRWLYARRVLLSDRDIRAEIAGGRLGIDPFDDTLVQPSSVDVRPGQIFRVFNNTRYTHIDPAKQQDEPHQRCRPPTGSLSSCIPASSCWAPRWSAAPCRRSGRPPSEGKVVPRSSGTVHPLHRRVHRPRPPGTSPGTVQRRQPPHHAVAGMKIGQLCLLRPHQSGRKLPRQRVGRVEVSGPARATPSRSYLNFIKSSS